ncbi:class III lanthionine synthetase LanKC [Streptomyces paromomycinus]|uniref:non-specific serine/threonine protein kinase n=1 Tax=Streptomyces paromomycinus TaxID=92743 RepID=A0A401W5Z2_STREY|nr:class III lanthionine synthetase LanKC [Streptomyces paromomycinus]GCD44726.1 serine/threonine protein kinase [Streptomyces paromomycinus]
MDLRYLDFCPTGSPFYDLPTDRPKAADFAAVDAPLPAGWTRTAGPEWVSLCPRAADLPDQGWKIHVSATPDNAGKVLDAVQGYCTQHAIPYKFLRGLDVLRRRNGKYGDRGSSGKFVTVYPRDEALLSTVLQELGDELDGEPGPYILSDLRWRQGPLYVRYGGFTARMGRNEAGEEVYCIEDPDGRLVPDVRGPGFRPPQWVELPECLVPALAARNAGTLKDFPFRATKALHFSNGGGVYQATDIRSGTDVLLKEARPLAGIDDTGADAVARLRREAWALRQLSGLACIPGLIEFRGGHEHYFLAREFIDGTSLSKELYRRNPLMNSDLSADRPSAYAAWALAVLDQVESGLDAMHERGVVFGDLHPNNVLIRSDGTVSFIDFEASSEPGDTAKQAFAAPGFLAPDGYTGVSIDRYALGCLRLAVFVPMTVVMSWAPEKVRQLIDLVEERFPVPADFAGQVWRDLGPLPARDTGASVPTSSGVGRTVSRSATGSTPQPEPLWSQPEPADWPGLRTKLADSILSTATPDRGDRLYPGDIEQFCTPAGGLSFAYGAAGVLWTLAEVGATVPEEHVDWLAGAGSRLVDARPGFYDGLAGVAFALDRLGHADEARELLDRAAAAPWPDRQQDLLGGLAGTGLTLLHFARRTGETALMEQAVRLAEELTSRVSQGPAGIASRRAPGLLRGAAGGALFLLRLYEETGEPKFLHHTVEALRTDLSSIGWLPKADATEGKPLRTPSIAFGSGGLGMVLHDVLQYCEDPELASARDAFRQAAGQHFLMQAGLFHGRAGVLLALHHLRDDAAGEHVVREHLTHMGLHAVPHEGRLLFLGDHNLRLSTDLATGTAGVLLALEAVLGTGGARLPFFGYRTEG